MGNVTHQSLVKLEAVSKETDISLVWGLYD